MAGTLSIDSRLTELLADRATLGLVAGEAEELARLLEKEPEIDPLALDLAAASIHLTAPFPDQALPPRLDARLQAEAARFTARMQQAQEARSPHLVSAGEDRRRPWVDRFGWYAAAACLIAAVAGWWPTGQEGPAPVATAPAPPAPVVPAAATFGEVAASADAVRLAWTATEDPSASGAGGEVVWSNELQQGYMKFTGLEVNDPNRAQYQLWIFDAEQDERYPIDGGVFDIDAGEVMVPIDAKLAVREPTLFAITVEKPGGVVVSSRERIVLVAAAA